MASEIRVDKINSLSGVGTVTLSPTGLDISGITTVSTLKVGTGVTASSDGDIFFTGIATATTFVGNLTGDPTGSGANLTALPAGQLTGTVADARISTLTASKLSGALPAISALNLTNVPAANVVGVHTSLNITGSTTTGTAVVGGGVTISESGIEASGIGITVANINGGQLAGRRNLIINGAMLISQRGPSQGSVTSTGYYDAPDRWRFVGSNAGTWTVSQSTTSPNLFKNSYKFDCTTADTSLGAGDFLAFDQALEGYTVQGLGWGTSDAKPVTVSFYVRSSKTGTYTCELFQGSGGVGGSNILVSKSYTISAADTWEFKTITFSGNTAVAFTNDNSRQLTLNLWLAAGSNFTGGTFSDGTFHNANNRRVASGQVNLADSTSNDWYITGVQLEVGTQATPYENRNYGEELALCRRYYVHVPRTQGIVMNGYNSTSVYGWYNWPVEMRTTPTNEYLIAAGATGCALYGDNAAKNLQSTSWNYLATHGGQLYFAGNFTQGSSYHFDASPAAGFTSLSAEL